MRALLLVALASVLPASLAAQVEITSNGLHIHLNGRVHAQYRTTSVDGPPSSEFLIRRARFVADVEVSDFVFGRVEPDYGEGEITLKDAYVRLNIDPAFRMSFGQFKRGFDIFELYSTTQILVVERAGGIDGVDACAGPGGVCSWSRLSEKLQYSARDIGVLFDGRANKFEYRAAITNGTGANNADENGAKSFSGRGVVQATPNVRVGANISVHDYAHPTLGDEHAVAYGADVEVGRFGEPFHLQAGLMGGDNWLNLDAGGDASTFFTAQGIVSYIIPLENTDRISGVEPHFRLNWADPDTGVDGAGGWLITPGVALRLNGRSKLVANVDVWSPSTGDTEWSFKFTSNMYF